MQIQDITFSTDTGHILDCSPRTTGALGGYASFFLLDLPLVAGWILTGERLHQMRAGLQRTAGLPQQPSSPLSEAWQEVEGGREVMSDEHAVISVQKIQQLFPLSHASR